MLTSASNYLGAFTRANLPAASAALAGMMALCTDLGAAPGVFLICSGTRWKTLAGEATLAMLGAPIAGITAAENLALQTLIPAGALTINDTLRIMLTLGKSGTVDNLQGAVYIGPLGTAADPAVIPSQVVLAAANLSAGVIFDIKLIAATSAQRLGSGPGSNSSSYSAPNAVAVPAAVAISSAATTPLYVTVGLRSSGATNTVAIYGGQIALATP